VKLPFFDWFLTNAAFPVLLKMPDSLWWGHIATCDK
jgi:hypothetical protein